MANDVVSTTSPGLLEDFNDFFESPVNGFLTVLPSGEVLRANTRFAQWLNLKPEDIQGKRFSSFLSVGGRMYYETHLSPLLRMQGYFEEVALELAPKNGHRLHVFANGYESRDSEGRALFVRLTINRATDRRLYEQTLNDARAVAETKLSDERKSALLREQFVAVLGHDLRNPLGALKAGTELLTRLNANAGEREKSILAMMKTSASRMAELITNVMDFARARLGDGMSVSLQPTLMQPILEHVVHELQTGSPDRVVHCDFRLETPVICDGARIAQLFSNLLANAYTHGSPEQPITVEASNVAGRFELSVSNGGAAISAGAIGRLFEPFTREVSSPSKQGLGLGLYIASEIARAHHAQLTATSSEAETRFTFWMATAGE